jgi:uncharacterized protein
VEIALLLVVGFAAGVLAGLFGVGGGVLFVPALVLVADLSQLEAEATSLLAIIPAAVAGTWQQQRYGNVQWRAALVVALAAIAGVEAGVRVAEALPEDVLRRLFAVLMIAVAAQLVLRVRRAAPERRET